MEISVTIDGVTFPIKVDQLVKAEIRTMIERADEVCSEKGWTSNHPAAVAAVALTDLIHMGSTVYFNRANQAEFERQRVDDDDEGIVHRG